MQDPLFQPTFPACLITEMPRSNREETCFKLFKLLGLGAQSSR